MTLITIVSHIVNHGQLVLIQYILNHHGKPMMLRTTHSEPISLTNSQLQEPIIQVILMQKLLWLLLLQIKQLLLSQQWSQLQVLNLPLHGQPQQLLMDMLKSTKDGITQMMKMISSIITVLEIYKLHKLAHIHLLSLEFTLELDLLLLLEVAQQHLIAQQENKSINAHAL